MRTAVVTGASGFIGRALCAQLEAAGWRVIGIARKPAEGPWARLLEHEFGFGRPLELGAEPDVVFHLAARTHALAESAAEEALYERTNVGGMRELLAALPARAGLRVVFASSVKAHGENTPADGVTEEAADAPTTPYGVTKLAAERLLRESALGAGAVVLRLAMVFGPGQKGNLVEMMRAVAARRFPPLPETGNRRSLVHVDDVVAALLAAAEAPAAAGRTFYVSGPRTWSARELFVALREANGLPVPRWTVPAGALYLAAAAGSATEWIVRRRLPWDLDRYDKLLGSAHYRGEAAAAVLGFTARNDLRDYLSEVAAEERRRR